MIVNYEFDIDFLLEMMPNAFECMVPTAFNPSDEDKDRELFALIDWFLCLAIGRLGNDFIVRESVHLIDWMFIASRSIVVRIDLLIVDEIALEFLLFLVGQ